MAFPMVRPISGRRFGPTMSRATRKMTISSAGPMLNMEGVSRILSPPLPEFLALRGDPVAVPLRSIRFGPELLDGGSDLSSELPNRAPQARDLPEQRDHQHEEPDGGRGAHGSPHDLWRVHARSV